MENEEQLQKNNNSILERNTVPKVSVGVGRSHTVPVHPKEYICFWYSKKTSIKYERDIAPRGSYDDDDSSLVGKSETSVEQPKDIPITQKIIDAPDWRTTVLKFILPIFIFYSSWFLIPRLHAFATSLLKPKPPPISAITKLIYNLHEMVGFAMEKLTGGLGQIFGMFKI